ncbi:helix-turn-helix domain-containing protein [Sinorhizobium meliloti]|uniref:HTH cro/C1-type domain-containing protein n=1 Tax=Rhizobium meliloti TaxID=382 RepID=A0A2J0YVB4_RHIML|nr:helix-turn-helix transcriptional regulator [Sinorhizobium meliloti]PJR11493.1 hypothetical protein CEJ86_27385 [Sinorhizobium meliloti]
MPDLSEITAMIHRLEQAGFSRKAIAEGANIGASQITRIMAGEARNPTLRVIRSIESVYRQHFAADPPQRDLPQRFAKGCQPRAGR